MTINICWLSSTSSGQAISLITDSRLSNGEMRFDECRKLFSLPRGDCLISFSGTTDIAYTLINQAISTVQTSRQSQSRYQDITELKGQLLNEISSLVSKIHIYFPNDDCGLKDIEIILAGYSWKNSRFEAWRIRSQAMTTPSHKIQNIKEKSIHYYHPDPLLCTFVADQKYFDNAKLIVTGTKDEANKVRSELYKRRRNSSSTEWEWGNEPIKVMRDILLSAHFKHDLETTSAGALQYMRVFKHGSTEMNAVLWPDNRNYWSPTICGRFVNQSENFDSPLFDPRICRVIQVPYYKNSLNNNSDYYDSIQKTKSVL